MNPLDNERLTDPELCRFLDRLFPNGFAGDDILAELAPEGWERSQLVACFHPSVERLCEERVRIDQNIETLGRLRRRTGDPAVSQAGRVPEPTIDDTRRAFAPTPIKPHEEVTELVGMCLWDVFSDNHDVIALDGRIADMGSFRGASAFLDEYLSGDGGSFREGDCLRFYMGTWAAADRADLTPVYSMIFSHLCSAGARWVYHFPELLLVELGSLDDADESPAKPYSPNEAMAAERKAREQQAEVSRLQVDIAEGNARARQAAMDAPPPAIIRAHRAVYGGDPPGWPPA